ncbi:tRNA pseudouridine(38-40) synthase TruA [Anaerosporobacter faecicola]|uniref:tRNA pseudouridine(38-40) synthase TruA n=1 Tax=Anaerosporobacter faecicola TaxID=2718714 RepID=UPI0014399F5E|nr:tRNA pseudouridine(38-40) synthase TruA [Anaerosporobacter faecicola]
MHKRNIRFQIAYDGTAYLGWQRLGGKQQERTIQGYLERCLSNLLKEDIKIMGSGRTDAGVHAFGQVANFYTSTTQSVESIQQSLRKILPEDLSVYGMKEMEKEFHSRYWAKSKIYEYYIDEQEREGVFTRKYAYHVNHRLDLSAMRKAATVFCGTHNFVAFSSDSQREDTVRTLYQVEVEEITDFIQHSGSRKDRLIRIRLHGDGFLYNMVRIIVGTLIEIGLGERKIETIEEAFERKERNIAGYTVPPHGLFLRSVQYEANKKSS